MIYIKKEIPVEALSTGIDELGLSVRAMGVMGKLKAKTLGDVVRYSANDILQLRNAGKTTVAEIKRRLADFGLELTE